MDQLPRLGKRELICLLLFTCNYVVSVWRGFLFLWVLGMGYVILLWHSLSLYFPHICCFHLHYAVLCLTNVNVKRPQTQYYGFCKVTFADKACPIIYRIDKSRTCTNDPNETALSDLNFLVIVSLNTSSWS